MNLARAMDQEYIKHVVQLWKAQDVFSYQRQLRWGFIMFTCQRLLTLTVQASFVGITKNLQRNLAGHALPGFFGEVDLLTFSNVIMGSLLGVQACYSETSLSLSMTKMVNEKVRVKLQSNNTKWVRYHLRLVRLRSLIESLIMLLFSSFSCMFLGYCIMKVVMALNCPCGVWNFTLNVFQSSVNADPSFRGCVPFTQDSNHSLCRMSVDWTAGSRRQHSNFSFGLDDSWMNYFPIPSEFCDLVAR